MSSSLVECGFISNPTEAQNLSSSSYQDKVAEGIVNGIMDYLNNNVILNYYLSMDLLIMLVLECCPAVNYHVLPDYII